VKDPVDDYEASMYRFADGGHGVPVMAFKAATVRGGGRVFGKQVKMTELRQVFTFLADGVSVNGQEPYPHPGRPEHAPRTWCASAWAPPTFATVAAVDWTATLRIDFVPSVISLESVIALVDAGGTNGIGEWRPEKSGSFGTYEVVGA